MKFSLPINILYIISIINDSGYQAHVVGGCVRDILINRVPSDWDITTNASPEIIKSLFPRTYDTGIKHGTVTVILEDMPYEITTWRKESSYTDHRHPDHISTAYSLTEDLARRDFTMNAMAYHPREGLVDPFGGFDDINCRSIRCVGIPSERFSEDALRMLRAVRFSAQLDFTIETDTLAEISKLSADLSHISKERIQTELNKILESPAPWRLSLLWETGLSSVIFPSIEQLAPLWSTLAKYFVGFTDQRSILLALLFFITFDDYRQEEARKLLNNLKYDNVTKISVSDYLNCLESLGPSSPRNIRKAVTEFGVSISADSLRALRIIRSDENKNKGLEIISKISPVELALSGEDLKNAGYQGKAIKDMLSILSLCVFEKPELNDSQTLLEIAGIIAPQIIK